MGNSNGSSPYLFGDTETATARLRLLADIFAPSSSGFLIDVVDDTPARIVDLGCGPGHTTSMLADCFPAAEVVGLDSSPAFLSLARAAGGRRLSFFEHDVTSIPFPTGPGDLLYCRFLLTHIVDPEETVRRWASQVFPDGLLIIEETEAIETSIPAFQEYLRIVEAMLAHNSGNLYAGRITDELDVSNLLRKRRNRSVTVRVSTPVNAQLYKMNLQIWRNRPIVRTSYSRAKIDGLEAQLDDLASVDDGQASVDYRIRQVVFKRKR